MSDHLVIRCCISSANLLPSVELLYTSCHCWNFKNPCDEKTRQFCSSEVLEFKKGIKKAVDILLKTVILVWLLPMFERGTLCLKIIQSLTYCSTSHSRMLAGAGNQHRGCEPTVTQWLTQSKLWYAKCIRELFETTHLGMEVAARGHKDNNAIVTSCNPSIFKERLKYSI